MLSFRLTSRSENVVPSPMVKVESTACPGKLSGLVFQTCLKESIPSLWARG